jgi:hypothetical protein
LEKDSNTLVSLKIHLSTIKSTFLCFNIHTYTFQIHYSTFQKPYILLIYIITPLLYSNILLKLCWDLSILHIFVLSLTLFFKTILAPHYSTKMSCTCHDMFIGIQNWDIFHEFHKSYWLMKYLNPKLILWDPINTCWTYTVARGQGRFFSAK